MAQSKLKKVRKMVSRVCFEDFLPMGTKFFWSRFLKFVLKNLCQLFDKYAVVRTEHDDLVKSMAKIFFQILRPSQKT